MLVASIVISSLALVISVVVAIVGSVYLSKMYREVRKMRSGYGGGNNMGDVDVDVLSIANFPPPQPVLDTSFKPVESEYLTNNKKNMIGSASPIQDDSSLVAMYDVSNHDARGGGSDFVTSYPQPYDG
jgi:hypothetical protein